MSQTHEAKVLKLQAQLADIYRESRTVRFKRSSTNSTRQRAAGGNAAEIDLTDLNEIVGLDSAARFIDIEPGVPMDALIAATLKENLMPLVVPEFPGITAGGAVQGGALESSSFKYGQLNDTVLEYDMLLGDGTRIVATPDNEYSDLFHGIATSHGSLSLVTRIRLKLEPAAKYVALDIRPCDSAAAVTETIEAHTKENTVDFIEGLLFSETLGAVITGRLTDKAEHPIRRFGRNIDPWYHRYMHQTAAEGGKSITVPLVDYLFRYDKGAFWMGEHLFPLFGVNSNPVTRFFLAPISRTRKLYDGLHAMNVQHEYVVQDFYMDWNDAARIVNYNASGPKIYPVWMCPIKSVTTPQKLSSHYRESEEMLLNVGIYGLPATGNAVNDTINLEKLILNLPSRKMLYAQTFYSQEDFWTKYDQDWYSGLRTKYKAAPFRELWSKIHTPNSAFQSRRVRGFIQVAVEALWGKNVVWGRK
ncbi:MAG: FAD-binding oxidoreductase [Methylacidiphilales bacterium]|nr:FAD-binding oxidoreductase [Candidatus Methylacidiphilales bacterium]